jgi:hypothetical protein
MKARQSALVLGWAATLGVLIHYVWSLNSSIFLPSVLRWILRS